MVANLADDFNAALDYSRRMRDTFLVHFYKRYSFDGRYVFVDKSACSTLLQKELAVDTVAQWSNRGSICIEEKIEQWPGHQRWNFALETESCTTPGRERKGWMHYAKADYLLYAFAFDGDIGLNAYLIDFPKLREWFWNLPTRYESYVMPTLNRTRFEKVPIQDVAKAVPTWHYIINSEGCKFIKKRATA
jgi:hypothetical protein